MCTTISFLPQVIKIWRTRHVADLSLPMYALFSFGTFCWLVFGIMIKSAPVVAANCVSFILSAYILTMILVYGKAK
jgi:MtN3 and saliva related transmembrane protein